ncbi:MAG TPA: histidinol dehydrogenase [Hyphomicrobiaceae bacterium]|nr:histidinol dehydrogenase [Hyphomicrobiaceae bacterium]
MPFRLATTDANFDEAFASFLASKREVSPDVDQTVAKIISDVRQRGDAALLDYTRRFDGIDLSVLGLRIEADEIKAAVRACDPATLEALALAKARIEAYHVRQLPQDEFFRDSLGAELGWRWSPIESVGLYVPGGLASYPSSLLMNAVPAKVAGVPRIAMTVPAPQGAINPSVLAAADMVGLTEIYRLGGAQAVAAFAYGSQSLTPVAKIIGPGNAYVAAAKRHVFGTVGIDAIAGPSEVLMIADQYNDAAWLAADLLAQAEHDSAAQAILMTDDAQFAERVEGELARQLRLLPRSDIAAASWREFGAVIILATLDQAPQLADRIAAEHVQIVTRDPDRLASQIRNAGAIFLGAYTPEVIGDYLAGSNHVLPTARSARFASGLGVLDFMKRTSVLRLDAAALRQLAAPTMTLARAEGLTAHERSVAVRLDPAADRP